MLTELAMLPTGWPLANSQLPKLEAGASSPVTDQLPKLAEAAVEEG